ncbi:MAG: MBL fold metallo-hydrolase [Clostridia bacterium]|nr:MBL fold metallo-hydrolase [Clostridia bacterium]
MKRFIAIILALLLMIPTGITAMASGGTITSVNLPVSQTEFYTNAAIESPVFYSSLECVVNNKTVTVDGFTWECSNYSSSTVGTYVFSAVAPSGYSFACDVPTITVDMNSGAPSRRTDYFISNDYKGQSISVKAAPDDATGNRLYDRTGFNDLRPTVANSDTSIHIVAGIDYKKKMTASTTANIALFDASVSSIHGGSYGTNYIGTTDIYVYGGSISQGLYAGGANGKFEGTTNIYLSGSPSIFLLMFGGHYNYGSLNASYGAVVGSEDVSYNGTVNVYIAEDFDGEISNIDYADADEINFYISSGANFDTSRYQMSRPNVNVYIDGVNYDLVTQVDYNGAEFVVGEYGTAEKDVIADDITVYVEDKEVVLSGIEWESDDYSANTEGVYTFSPVLPDNYRLATGVKLPEVSVLVANSGGATINSVSYKNKTVIPDGISENELDMPDTVTTEFTVNGTVYTYDVPATFTSQNYSSTPGTYSFALSVDDVFTATSLPSMSVTVSENASVTKSGDVYEVASAGIRFSGEERGNYKVTDVAGIYTYFDNVDVVNAVYAKGTGVEIVIDSDVVYVNNKIDLNGTSGKVTLDIPKALVTRVRYASSIAKYVYINGVQMSKYTSLTPSLNSAKTYVYANGIPSIVAYGEDGGTHLYRANDMSLLYSGDMTGNRVYGGGQSGTTVESTNIAFMSGYLYKILGGGDGTVKDSTLVVDGGVAHYFRGGGTSGSVTLKATVIIEDGTARENFVSGGEAGSVMGDSSKAYADDEYTIDIRVYGGALSYLYLGSSGNVYGNVKMVQHDGEFADVNSSGNGIVYGNVEVKVYDGLWQSEYISKNIQGTQTLELYKGIIHHDRTTYPNITGDRVNVTYFGHDEEFVHTRYTNNRDAVISTADDAGKLVVRFLETRLPGHHKYKQRYYSASGDIIYITFPNGQNMLVDTGVHINYVTCIATLKELGVTKLDYVLLTHEHGDHIGAIRKLASTFPIDTFILQKLDSTDWKIREAITTNNSDVVYMERYDSMMIGEVELYALNPSDSLTGVNPSSMATVLTFGDSKVLLGADTYEETEKNWLADKIVAEKIKDCNLLKLGHHGYFTSNYYKYIDHVNPDKIVMTNMNEYGVCVSVMEYQLMHINGINRNDFSVTGQNGLVKYTLDGSGGVPLTEQEYVRIEPYYADYSEVYNVINEYNNYNYTLTPEVTARWEEALSLVQYNLPYEDQHIVDGMAEYLRNVFEGSVLKRTVTAVDTSKLVMETKFLYPGEDLAWGTKSRTTYVESPTFYKTLRVKEKGEWKNVDVVEWVCTNVNGEEVAFDGTAIDTTYYFKPVLPSNYEWGADVEVPRIKVEIIDGALIYNVYKSGGVVTSHKEAIPLVYKDEGDIYDATGFNKMGTDNYIFGAGLILYSTGATKEALTTPAYDTDLSVTGTVTKITAGGGVNLALDGSTYVKVYDATDSTAVYGGGIARAANSVATVSGDTHVTVTDSTVASVYGGGYGANNGGQDVTVAGNAYIDISGLVDIGTVQGGGYCYMETSISPVLGTAYVNIHNLEVGSAITNIARGTASKLVVNLDDTSAHLVSVITDVDTDTDIRVYINGKLYGAQPIVLTESMINYRLRCTTAVVDGNLVLTADPAGTSSMKVRLGNLPEGATVAIVGTNVNASMSSAIITVTNPGMKNVNVPMTITSAEGIVTEFVLVADFDNAIRYATYARLSQTGNNITVTSGAATAYVLFDTTDIDGGYVEVENVSRNLLGRYAISGSAVRFYNPVYDEGTVTVNVKNGDGETVATYNVTAIFADATEYTPVLESSLRCTYTVDGDNITVTAIVGATNVYLNFGRYYAETLTASVNDELVKKMGARSWRIMRTEVPVQFDVYFDATAYGAEKVTRRINVRF